MRQLTEADGANSASTVGDSENNNGIDQHQNRSEALTKLRQWRTRISTGKMDQILPGLFVGGLREAMNVPLLSENGISAVVSVRGLSPECHFGPGIALLRLTLSDSPGENIFQHFPAVNSFVHGHRLENENVLIHCLAGVSRSVCLCLAYLMTVTNLDYPNALDFVCRRHFGAKPNFGFKMQLTKFGQQFVQRERRRLFAEFSHFAGQLRDQFQSDCMFTNSLYVGGSPEAIFAENGTDKSQKRHGDGKEAESEHQPRHSVDEDYLRAEKRHRKSAKGTAKSGNGTGICSPTSPLAFAEEEALPSAAEGGTSAARRRKPSGEEKGGGSQRMAHE
ncbi:hypothetical protein niasHT_035355 [Heterodera trifolii]|uniref:Dual specificity protein phosphatase n=1 Tax=Heterodera trifolii TaxID=157864 RepID=A0ABD2HXM1_9BILA